LLRARRVHGKNQDGERISLRVHKRPHGWRSSCVAITALLSLLPVAWLASRSRGPVAIR
jgi:hypothetical protein